MRSDQQLQAADQRSDEEARHTSVHAVRHAAVISLTKFVGKIRIGDGVTEASEVLAVVTHDVAVMKGDHLALASGQHIAVGRPTAASFSLEPDIDLVRDEGVQQCLDPGAGVPNDADSLRELGKKLLGQSELQGGGLIQGDDDFIDISNLAENPDDSLESGPLQLRIERWQDQGDRSRPRVPFEFLLELLDIGLAETVENGHDTILIEIRHDIPLCGSLIIAESRSRVKYR